MSTELLLGAVNRELERISRKRMNIPDDWVWKDIPRAPPSYYEMLREVVGEVNYRFVCGSKFGGSRRETWFISPEGMTAIADFVKTRSTEH